jgi:hypothetical protein
MSVLSILLHIKHRLLAADALRHCLTIRTACSTLSTSVYTNNLRPSCTRQHPTSGHLWCWREAPNGCSNPDCHMKHKLPITFKLSWGFLCRTVGEERAVQFSVQPFGSFAAVVAYGSTLNSSSSRERLPYHCVASSREWSVHLRAVLLPLVLKFGTTFLLSSTSSSSDGRASDSALERCATALVQWIQQNSTANTAATAVEVE